MHEVVKCLQSDNYQVEVGSILNSSLDKILNNEFLNDKKIIIVDENTKEFCLEYIITSFLQLADAEIIELPAGEENKQLEICYQVWETLTEYKIDRNALIINLGGGVITDTGGFIASIYKRGIQFVNIPTTLLSMVDASVGGKTGVDLGVYKNQLGLFSFPFRIYVDPIFLKTLDKEQIHNGISEMLKHGLIKSKDHWNVLSNLLENKIEVDSEIIYESINIKNEVVIADPFEKGERKKLNFGHTVGHAIESYFLQLEKPILHGAAIVAGMMIESYISTKSELLSVNQLNDIVFLMKKNYKKIEFSSDAIPQLIEYMNQDKKNKAGKINMVLLNEIGKATFNLVVEEQIIKESLNWYINDCY
jgi:3-dehydroquinate synthase